MARHNRRDGWIAIGLFVVLIGVFLAFPWFIPDESATVILGLPAWYWLTLGVMAFLYVVYYLFTTRIDAFYAFLEVSD